ncbi:BTB domain-containing protein [Mycena venus]|uniref:BTB domain-containing protein n=1 Tax=Mycena venus TaxID=2733690 RepID=A0A8H6XEG3_9AGAR|nr:BTB domain-containing protein [Mycena venus]
MQSTESPPLYRVPSLWFEDDNLILRAQNTLFRVSKGVLAARSSVFRDMLAFPQSPQMRSPCSEGEMYDGDGEEIIEGAIFDSSFFEPPPAKTDLAAITGILRLSHKYDVQYLRRRALLHLDTGYPTSLAVYEVSGSETFSSDGLGDSLLTIQCASEVGATWVLPTAFYFLCYSDMRDILNCERWGALSEVDRGDDHCILHAPTPRLPACPALLAHPLHGGVYLARSVFRV